MATAADGSHKKSPDSIPWTGDNPQAILQDNWNQVRQERVRCLCIHSKEGSQTTQRVRNKLQQLIGATSLYHISLKEQGFFLPYSPFTDLLLTTRQNLPLLQAGGLAHSRVYPLQQPILESFLQGEETRREEAVLATEFNYERRCMLSSLFSLLQLLAEEEPLIILVENFHLASQSGLEFADYLFHQRLQGKLFFLFVCDKQHEPTTPGPSGAWDHFVSTLENEGLLLDADSLPEIQDTNQPENPPHLLPRPISSAQCIRLARDYFNFLAFEECRDLALSLYEQYQSGELVPNDQETYSLLETLGDVHAYFSDEDSAILFYNILLNQAQERGTQDLIAVIQRKIGTMYVRKAQFELARKFIDQSMYLSRSLENRQLEYQAMFAQAILLEMSLEISYASMQNYVTHLEAAIALGEQLGLHNSLCFLYEKAAFFWVSLDAADDKPVAYHSRAISLAEQLHNEFRLAALYGSQGVFYSIRNDRQEAMRNYARSLRIKIRIGEPAEAAKTCNSIGYLYYLTGRYAKAVRYYARAVAFLKGLMDFREITMTLYNLMQAYHYAQYHDMALKCGETILRICSLLKMKSLPMTSLVEVNALIAITCLKQGQTEKALQYHHKVGTVVTGNEQYYSQLLDALVACRQGDHDRADQAFQAILSSLADKERPFFMKNYAPYYSIPYHYEYGLMLRQAGRKKQARLQFEQGLALARQLDQVFYSHLLQQALQEDAGPVPRPRLGRFPIDTEALGTLAVQQSRFLRQEKNINQLHKRISEIHFLNNLQNILGRHVHKQALVTEVMGYIQNNLLVELGMFFLHKNDRWECAFCSGSSGEIDFDMEKLLHILEQGNGERLVPDTARSKDVRFLAGTICSLLAIRLHIKQAPAGLLICCTRREGLHYGKEDLRILSIAARQLAVALERIELIDQLREMDELKSQFFTNVSHETKTPLTLIGNYLEQYIDRHGSSEELEIIKQNIKKLQRDMVNFLDGEKLRKGGIFYKHDQLIDYSDLVAKKVILFREMGERKGIHVEAAIASHTYILADPFAIDRVLNNLLDNAIKYTKKGGQIQVSLEQKGDTSLLKVADNGIGMSPEQQEHIFELYHQITHRKRNLQGIGMGLYIVHKIVESMEGTISVTSAEGRGSTFSITIPCAPRPPGSTATRVSYSTPMSTMADKDMPRERTHSPDLPTLLVVEDNPSLLSFLHSGLADRFNVYLARNGNEALRRLKEIPAPDLILSDIMMDEVDGHQLFEQVSTDHALQDIPFMFLSARSSLPERLQGLRDGAIDYITKPFTLEELEARISSVVRFSRLKEQVHEMERMASLGQLLAGISHEIFNPLSIISAPLEILEHLLAFLPTPEREKAGKAVFHIREGMQRIEGIISSLKSLYYNSPLEKEWINPHQIVDIVSSFALKQGSKQIRLVNQLPEDLKIYCNYNALTRIFINLISNARDAIQEKGHIQVRSKNKNGTLLLEVEDNGSGIEKEKLAKVFDIFYTTKKAGKGTGLGLYIVKDLVSRMGWEISLASCPGQGTTSTITVGASGYATES